MKIAFASTGEPPRPFWPPLLAGVLLGLALLLTFWIRGHGLGASGFFTALTAALGSLLAPTASEASRYLAPYLAGNPFAGWITWEVLGLFIGGLAGALASGRFRATVERGRGLAVGPRLGWAFAGGLLVGFGARLARGCTSGLALSGGATLSVAAFLFLLTFFAAGFAAMALIRRNWQ